MKILIFLLVTTLAFADAKPKFIVGFFLGGRTGTFFRMVRDDSKHLNYEVDLLTKDIRQDTFYVVKEVPKNIGSKFSKATGDELIDQVLKGNADAALIGETSFIKMVHKKLPLIAIAETGHDVKGQAGHAMVFKAGIDIKNPKKWKGLTFGARRSAGGDLIVLKEFLASQGVDPERDVKIIDQIDDDKFQMMFDSNKIQAGYVHLSSIRHWQESKPNDYQIHSALDWINPEISMALLVVNKNFLEKNKKDLATLVNYYSTYIIKEKNLPVHVKRKKGARGIQMDEDYKGMNFPQSYDCPYVRTNLLNEWQKILVKYKVVNSEAALEPYIDNSLFKCK